MLRDCLSIQHGGNLFRGARSVGYITEQVLKMKLRILDIVRLGSIDVSQCLPLEICSEVLGVGEVPRFEMPLRIRVLNARFELAAKTTP